MVWPRCQLAGTAVRLEGATPAVLARISSFEFDLNGGPHLSTSATSVKGNSQVGEGSINVKRAIGDRKVARTEIHAIQYGYCIEASADGVNEFHA